jgi:hypothetical protein
MWSNCIVKMVGIAGLFVHGSSPLILYLPRLEVSEGCDPLYAVISQILQINMQAVSLDSIRPAL